MPCPYCQKSGHNITCCDLLNEEIKKWSYVTFDMSIQIDWPLNPYIPQFDYNAYININNLRLNQLLWNVTYNIKPIYLKQFKKRIKLFEKNDLINKNNLLLESSKKYLSVRRLYICKIIDKYNIPYDLYEYLS